MPIQPNEDAKRFKTELKKPQGEKPKKKFRTNNNSSLRESKKELMAVSLRKSFHDTNGQLQVSHSVLGRGRSGSESAETSEKQQPKSRTSFNKSGAIAEAERFNMATYNMSHSKDSPRTKEITQPILAHANSPQAFAHDRIDEKTDEGEP